MNKVIRRNKSLVILPFRGTPTYTIREDCLSKIRLKGIAEKYGFVAIASDLDFWYRTLKGWKP